MLGNIAHPAYPLVPGQQGQQPEHQVQPGLAGQCQQTQQNEIAQQKRAFVPQDAGQPIHRAARPFRRRLELRHAPLIAGDTQQIAHGLAPKALA